MHAPLDIGRGSKQIAHIPTAPILDFLWLELTNRCNLRCVHCYTESHPLSGDRDILTTDDYERLMREAYDLGCRKTQFIGGEPQLNRDFQKLLVTAKTIGFEFIEVFSNLTQLKEETLCYAADNGICFATSVYSNEPEQHDAITKVRSSHARTINNLKRLIDKGIETRAATIEINQDRAQLKRTKRFLSELGVTHVRSAELREFGRGEELLARSARLEGLCGHCCFGKLCITPDGTTYPCVMARQWPVGNVLEMSLAEIVGGKPLEGMRQTIYDTVWVPKIAAHKPGKKPGKKPKKPAEECPQSGDCHPSCAESCVPFTCPQSCTPIPECTPDEPKTKKEDAGKPKKKKEKSKKKKK
jgi:MoaA/NifB/PqqE/SkfB family radical SAM enzyme